VRLPRDDRRLIGRIVAFGGPSGRLLPAEDNRETRRAFRAVLIGTARKNRQFWIDWQAAGGRIDIAPGWFRVEVQQDVGELYRAMKLAADQPTGPS
jgi:hypothetical protein